jgi:hypothetical protein
MRKKINVKPVNELELVFEDGKSLILKFDMEALLHFNDVAEGLFQDISIPEICAKVIYIGGANYNDGFDLKEARKIVSNLDPETITVIINEFTANMNIEMNEVQKELSKKLMEQFLSTKK